MKEQSLPELIGFDPQWLLLFLAPVFLATIAAEFLYLRRHGDRWPSARYTWTDTVSNTVLAGLYQASDLVAALFILNLYYVIYGFRIWDIPLSFASLALLLLVQDFFYYWFHRAHHRIRFFWCSHVVHHSSERLNLSTAFRQSVTYPITGMWLFWAPMVLIGFPPEAVLFTVAVSLAYQFFIHTQVVGRLGPLEWILNTPSHHRAHHGRNPRYIDRNYGGILIIWDRLFGTFVEEGPEEAPDYGIPQQIHSHNPITLNFHEWRDMLRDMTRPGLTPAQRLWLVAGPPEARRDLLTENSNVKSNILKARTAKREQPGEVLPGP